MHVHNTTSYATEWTIIQQDTTPHKIYIIWNESIWIWNLRVLRKRIVVSIKGLFQEERVTKFCEYTNTTLGLQKGLPQRYKPGGASYFLSAQTLRMCVLNVLNMILNWSFPEKFNCYMRKFYNRKSLLKFWISFVRTSFVKFQMLQLTKEN